MNPHHTTPNASAPIEAGEIKAAPRNDPHYQAIRASNVYKLFRISNSDLQIAGNEAYLFPKRGNFTRINIITNPLTASKTTD